MLKALKSLFAPKVRAQKYGCMNEFFNTKMEETRALIVTCPILLPPPLGLEGGEEFGLLGRNPNPLSASL
jgi:hypothetical protein